MRVVRSTFAHGRIRNIDTGRALRAPGVHRDLDRADVADIPPIDFRLTRIEGLEPYRQPVLAQDRVRYVGDPVAAVFADDPYLAEDAADLVELDDRGTAGRCSMRAQRRANSSRAARPSRRSSARATAMSRPHSATRMPSSSSISQSAGIPACRWKRAARSRRYDAARDVLELYGAAKVPHWNRDQLARMLGRGPSSMHLYEGHVGGGFGIRGELYPEDVLVCAAALRLGRPVKWIEDRREHLIAANHSRQQRHRIRAAIDDAGTHPRASTMNSSTTRAPMCARMAAPCRTSPPRCCRARIGCRIIARSAISA